MAVVTKSVKQYGYSPSPKILDMLETFRRMVNDSIRIGLQHDVSTMKRLSMLAYHQLSGYDIASYYKKCAISKAAGILANRKKSIRRGYPTKTPFMRKPLLELSFGFKLEDRLLKMPSGNGYYYSIELNKYVKSILLLDHSIKIRSFILTPTSVSICYSKEAMEIECFTTTGIDRNLKNLSVGNYKAVIQYNLSKATQIAENTREIVRSFKRNDIRIRKKIASKYGRRKSNRIKQLLHRLSKTIVQQAKGEKTALVFEDIRHIRKLYQTNNHHRRSFRYRMNNGWSFGEIKRQVEYKAKWEGLPVIQLSVGDTRGTSKLCPLCGKRTQVAERVDITHYRELWCSQCKRWMDRDVIAVLNIAMKGGESFHRSQGVACEAMKGNPASVMPVILRVDATKLLRVAKNTT